MLQELYMKLGATTRLFWGLETLEESSGELLLCRGMALSFRHI